jgi:hypothetical protein
MGAAEEFVGKAEQIVNDLNYTARDAGDSLLDTIRHNPLPAAMAGIGLGLLITRRRGGHSHHPRDARDYRSWQYDDEYPSPGRRQLLHDRDQGASGRIGPVPDRASGMLGDAKGSS